MGQCPLNVQEGLKVGKEKEGVAESVERKAEETLVTEAQRRTPETSVGLLEKKVKPTEKHEALEETIAGITEDSKPTSLKSKIYGPQLLVKREFHNVFKNAALKEGGSNLMAKKVGSIQGTTLKKLDKANKKEK